MMDRRVTLITGSNKGIGKFLAGHYLDMGHLVVGCGRGECDQERDGYSYVRLDVADEKSVKSLFLRIRRDLGRLDHLINNAGIASMNHSLLTPLDTVKRVLSTNVIGTFLFSREAAKLMKKKHYGRIVNFSTVAVPLKLEGESVYVASKAGIEGLTHVLAREFAEFGITVNAVGPSPVQTDLIRSVPEDKIRALLGRQAVKEIGHVEDVSNVVDFFLREESRLVTGQVLYLGGL